MAYDSRVVYTGDAVTTDFTVPFPYISTSHVRVYVNDALQLNPMHWSWQNSSTIRFSDAPGIDAAIEIKRVTSPSSILVDFVDGSTLRAGDLDTAYLHNFYLGQEYADSFNELINQAVTDVATGAGIIETETDEVIAALVNEMLNQAAASTLQQRVNDIDTNAEAIISLGESLQVQINTIAEAAAATVFVQATEPVPGVSGVPDPIPEGARWYDTSNNNAPYIYQSGAWVSITDPRIGEAQADITVLQAETAGNSAALLSESLVRTQQFEALASQLDLIGVANNDLTAFVMDLNTVEIDQTSGTTLAQKFTLLETADSNNEASITAEQSARISGDNANASDITALDSRLTTAEGDVISNAGAISVLQTDVSGNAADIATANANISANASAITAVESEVDLRSTVFVQSTQPTANNPNDMWIDTDDNKIYTWNGSVWTERTNTAIAANASAISSLESDVTAAEGDIAANASSITSLNASVTSLDGRVDTAEIDIAANVSAISSNDSDITTLYAKYGVTLSVNNYVSGFIQNNDGTSGNFVVLADKFAVVTPSQAWQASTAYSLGDTIRPTSHNGRVYECTTAGTSGGSEPSWTLTLGGTNADGSVVWTCRDDASRSPFTISGDKIRFQGDVEIDGSLMLNGTIIGSALVPGTIGTTQIGPNAIDTDQLNAGAVTAIKIEAGAVTAGKINVTDLAAINADLGAVTAGTLELDGAGWIKGGQSAFNTGTGYFLGYEGGYKFSIGSPTGDRITWDGSLLTIVGDVKVGEYIVDATETIAEANTQRSKTGTSVTEVKKFTMDRAGDVRVYYERQHTGASYSNGVTRIKKNGSIKYTLSEGSTTWASTYFDLTGANTCAEGDEITIEYGSGQFYTDSPEPGTVYIRNAQLRAVVTIPGEATVNTN